VPQHDPAWIKIDEAGDRVVSIGPEHCDGQGWLTRLADAFGSPSADFGTSQIDLLSNALRVGADVDNEVNAALVAIDGVRPCDEIEAMLASQMAVTHSLAMEMLGRARRVDQIPQVDCAGNLAVKLLRTYVAQSEALAKLRRGGEQVVRVEHVHVHSGGQAIVGSVTHGQGTTQGGVSDEKLEQPHAKTAVSGKRRCRMHGGAKGSGAPSGKRNGNYRHGGYTTESLAMLRSIREWARIAKATADDLE
jgi:hypothetical protein